MKIEANDKSVQDIFSAGYFKIPRFQRPYSWDIEEVESFWNDILKEKADNYFIGSMVVFQTKKPYFGIVDGQQRLTTITIILSALRNAFLKIKEENLARGIHNYIEKANVDNEDELILNSESSFPYLHHHIQSFNGLNVKFEVGSEEKKLEQAFQLINSKINDIIPFDSINCELDDLFGGNKAHYINVLKEIRDKILSLKLVFIQLENEDDAYLIFETLNARGKDLSAADLVKNLILKIIKTKSASIDQAKESWNLIIKKFDDVKENDVVDNFLVHYWCSSYAYCTKKELFVEVKNSIGLELGRAKIFLEDLSQNSDYYSALIVPDRYNWSPEEKEVERVLKTLNLFKVKQQTAFTLALLRAYKNKKITIKNLKKSLRWIEIFHYFFNAVTSQRSSGVVATNYSKLAIKLQNAEDNDDVQVVFNELKKFILEKIPDEDEFVVKFTELEYSSKKTKDKSIVKYTLANLIPKTHAALNVDQEKLTIEHILPESDIKSNPNANISNIGNLLLIDKTVNGEELKNKKPIEKILILKQKEYPFSEFDSNEIFNPWDNLKIDIRAKKMASFIYQSLKKEIEFN